MVDGEDNHHHLIDHHLEEKDKEKEKEVDKEKMIITERDLMIITVEEIKEIIVNHIYQMMTMASKSEAYHLHSHNGMYKTSSTTITS